MNKCKNCKYQGKEQYGLHECDYAIGMESEPKEIDQTRVYTIDDLDYYSRLLVGSEFGCINFKEKENK